MIADVSDDGAVTIAGRRYRVPLNVRRAIQEHPELFIAGALGPDVYPDPLAGQTTTHPGVENGWQADDWLRWISRTGSAYDLAADSDEVRDDAEGLRRVAFVYGFNAHFAGDIFAHSYVNAYSGGTFDLLDGEQDVERRHAILERYIDAHLPPPAGGAIASADGMRPPVAFIADRLILQNDAGGQYLRPPTLHLWAMGEMYRRTGDLESGLRALEKPIDDAMAAYDRIYRTLQDQVFGARAQVHIAQEGLENARRALQLKRDILAAAEQKLREALTLLNAPEAVYRQIEDLTQKIKRLREAIRPEEIVLDNFGAQYRTLQSGLTKAYDKITDFICTIVDPFDWFGCDRKRNRLIRAHNRIVRNLDRLWSAYQRAYRTVEDAMPEIREAEEELIDLRRRFSEATQGMATQALQRAVDVANAAIDAQESVVAFADRRLADLGRALERAEAEFAPVSDIMDQAREALNIFGTIRALVSNWRNDMRIAARHYVEASWRAGFLMYRGETGALSEYLRWYRCYGAVFVGVPRQVGEAGCLAGDFVVKLRDEFDRLYGRLPEPLRWLLNPTGELKDMLRERLEPQIQEATTRLANLIGEHSSLGELIIVLGYPELATRDRLNRIYATDLGGTGLIRFDDAASLIEADSGMNVAGRVDPQRFPALAHSVTLAKLALLGDSELNRLIRDLSNGYVSPRYGASVYRFREPNQTILHDMVRSLDGNHQWQAFGLPRPRAGGPAETPRELPFGRNGFEDGNRGLRIWTDPGLRERVFARLFPGAIIGSLGNRPELQRPLYPFPHCPENPFPSAQDASGALQSSDPGCSD